MMKDLEKKGELSVVVSPELDSALVDTEGEEEDVFQIKEGGPDYRGVSCLGAAVLIAKAQFGLGVLGIPLTFSALGFFPGCLTLIVLCALSTWSGFVVSNFRLRHPHVYSIGDAAEFMFGKPGREFMGGAYWLYYVLVYAASLLTLTIAFNSLGNHSACTVIWIAVGAIITFILGSAIRTMKVMSWCGYVGLASVFVSAWTVAIACLCQSRPAGAAAGEVVNKNIVAFSSGKSFAAIASAVAVQILSLASTAAYFTIHSEMREPKKFGKSLILGQGLVIISYIAIGCIVYGKVGDYVTSPALGSAGKLIQKICYGLALPGLIFLCFYNAHFSAKYAFVRLLRGSPHLQSNTVRHWVTWLSMVMIVTLVGFIVAGAIPFFDDLLALMGSLISSMFMLLFPGSLTLYDLRNELKANGNVHYKLASSRRLSNKQMMRAALGVFVICFGCFITVGGLYGAVISILNNYKDGTVDSAFSCADNS